MATLVTIEDAKAQAGITITDDDALIDLHLNQAEAFVLRHIRRPTDVDWTAEIAAWTPETVPLHIQAAILRMFVNLHSDRGDEPANRWRETVNGLPPEVDVLLRPYRDHVLA